MRRTDDGIHPLEVADSGKKFARPNTPGKFNVTKKSKKITDHVNIPKKHCLRFFVNMK